MARRPAPLLLSLAVLTAACGGSRHELEVSFASGVDPDAVRYVELLVLPRCPEGPIVDVGDPPTQQAVARLGLARDPSGGFPALDPLPPGRYGFYARGYDQTCHAIVSTCVPVRLGDEDGAVRLALAPTTSPTLACDSGAICRDGRCDAPDGGDGTTNCGAGQYQMIAPTGTDDRVCGTCVTCSSTQYETAPCANGNSPQQRTCALLTQCGSGQFASVPATATSDRVCASCHVCEVGQDVVTECSNGNGPNDRSCSGGIGTCTLVASKDGQSDPSGSNGATTMATTNTGVQNFVAFVGFDLTGTCAEGGTIPAGATVTAATLTLTMATACTCSGVAVNHELRRATADWTESSVLTTSSPGVAGSATATFAAPSTGAAVAISSATLVTDVQGFLDAPGSNDGFRIAQTGGSGNTASPWRWATREAATASTRPRLEITFERP